MVKVLFVHVLLDLSFCPTTKHANQSTRVKRKTKVVARTSVMSAIKMVFSVRVLKDSNLKRMEKLAKKVIF